MEEEARIFPSLRLHGGFLMDQSTLIGVLSIVFCFLSLVITFRLYFSFFPKRNYNPTKFIARVAMFGAFSAILYVVPIFTVNLPFIPSFLSLHFDEIPAFIAGFAYGPWCAFAVIAIKTIIKLPMTSTLCVGELTDFLLSCVYVGTATFIYKRKRNLKGVAIGFGVSTLLQVLSAMLLNVYAMIPFYMSLYGINEEGLLAVMQLANPAIKDIGWSYAVFAVLPFNLIKDAIVVALTFVVYRSIHKLLRFDK